MDAESGSQNYAQIWLTQTLAAGPKESAQIKAHAEHCGIGTKALRKAREYLGLKTTRHGSGATMRSVWALPDQSLIAEGDHGKLTTAGSDAAFIRASEQSSVELSRAENSGSLGEPDHLLTNAGLLPGEGSSADAIAVIGAPPRTLTTATVAGPSFDRAEHAQDANFCQGFAGSNWTAETVVDATLRGTHHHPPASVRRRSVAALPAETVALIGASADAYLTDDERRRLASRVDLFVQRGLHTNEAREVAIALVERDRRSVHAVGSCIECQTFVRRECSVLQPVVAIHECWSRRHDAP